MNIRGNGFSAGAAAAAASLAVEFAIMQPANADSVIPKPSWELTNAWAAGKELYDPTSGQWKAIGPPRPHFVSGITFKASGPQVLLAPGPTEFISERHVKSSPAILLASVVGVNPESLTKLTLNGVPQSLRTGNFTLSAPLREGQNVFILAATDSQGRTAKATTEVYLNTSV